MVYVKQILMIFAICISSFLTNGQNVNYDLENWPGKNGTIKNNIEIPEQLLKQHGASLTTGSNEYSFFLRIPVDDTDEVRIGRIQAGIFPTCEAAQLGLVKHLNELTTPNKPKRLNTKDYELGDIAFGNSFNGMLYLVFTRNNVLVVVQCETNKAKEIALTFDKLIKNAPDCKNGQSKPAFNLKTK